MNKFITGLYKAPGKPIETRTIQNTLEALQELVGGYIETFTVASDCVLICNEEGRLRDLPANFWFCGNLFVGPVFICSQHGGDFISLHLSDAAEKHIKASISGGDCFGLPYVMRGGKYD